MRVRYGAHGNKAKQVAKIYASREHRIDVKRVDKDAIKVIKRLNDKGFSAYLVGGAVRDLLIDRYPKDFDIVTDAKPNEIKKFFSNARVIGRRFRLVHVHFPGKIIEVSTFRASQNDEEGDQPVKYNNNVYGSMEEDVHRRDFSINALYYDPIQEELFDFVEGYGDIKRRRMRSLIPLNKTFMEDPVRMIRAVKYSVQHGFKIPWRLRRSIKKHSVELDRCPPSRLTEEMFKIIESGYSAQILRTMILYKLLERFLPIIDALLKDKSSRDRDKFFESIEKVDQRVREKGEKRRGRLIAALVEGVCIFPEEWENTTFLFQDMFKEVKRLIEPLTPPNQEVEMAVVWLFREQGIQAPPHIMKKRRPVPSAQKRRRKYLPHHRKNRE
ncbi:MAG: polynucleotide adenylyltransferase PcnB [Spirochaetia bacterium]